MNHLELFLIAIGLAMDAFAVSLCKGLSMKRFDVARAVFIGVLFGAFQAVMPLIGFYLGKHLAHFIGRFDHWLAFILLVFVGLKMIGEARKNNNDEAESEKKDIVTQEKGDLQELFILAVATSIDALAIGLTFAVLPHIRIEYAVSVIGFVTAILCILAVAIGHRFGTALGSKAEFFGGAILVFLGVKILLEYLHIHLW